MTDMAGLFAGDYEDEVRVLKKRIKELTAALHNVAETYDDSYRVGSQERRLGDLARAALEERK